MSFLGSTRSIYIADGLLSLYGSTIKHPAPLCGGFLDIVNARRMRTSVTVVCLSVCVLPVYWLHIRFMLENEHTSQLHADLLRFSTLGFHYKAFVEELWLYSFLLACESAIFFSTCMLSCLLIARTIYLYHLLLIGTLVVHRACAI